VRLSEERLRELALGALDASLWREKKGIEGKTEWQPDPEKDKYLEFAGELIASLEVDERLRLLVSATREGGGIRVPRGALGVTDRRALFVWKREINEWSLPELTAEFETHGSVLSAIGSRSSLKLQSPANKTSFMNAEPAFEAERLPSLLEDESQQPPSCALAIYGQARVYLDRLVTPEGKSWPLTGIATSIGSGGDLSVTRGRNVGAGAAGLALYGPVGLLAGSAKHQAFDTRQLYLLVEGRDWAWSLQAHPDSQHALEVFAQTLRLISRTEGIAA
jgi:hypothetical protein